MLAMLIAKLLSATADRLVRKLAVGHVNIAQILVSVQFLVVPLLAVREDIVLPLKEVHVRHTGSATLIKLAKIHSVFLSKEVFAQPVTSVKLDSVHKARQIQPLPSIVFTRTEIHVVKIPNVFLVHAPQ